MDPATDKEYEENEVSPDKRSLQQSVFALATKLRIGMDLTSFPLPAAFLLPRSMLELFSESTLNFSHLMLEASECADPLDRFLGVLHHAISTIALYELGKKPFNPILGETIQGTVLYKGNMASETVFEGEQVSHHPPVHAFYFANQEKATNHHSHWEIQSSFWGKHAKASLCGEGITTFEKFDEEYIQTETPSLLFRILRWAMEFAGDLRLRCEKTNLQAVISFKDKPVFRGKWHEIHGFVTRHGEGKEERLLELSGHWDGIIQVKDLQANVIKQVWDRTQLRADEIHMDDSLETSTHKIWGKVTNALHSGNTSEANREKKKVEDTQRKKSKEGKHHPRLFIFESGWKHKS